MSHKHPQDETQPPAPKDETIEMIAVEPKAADEPRSFQTPSTRPVDAPAEGETYDHLAIREAHAEDRQEALLDEALEETFPGSDPISPKHIT